MRFRHASVLVALLAAPVLPELLAAQAGGPYAPIVLLLPSGARTLALGNVGVAGRDDDALFFNPAQLAVARGMSASGERYSSTAGGGALSAVTAFNGGGIGVGMQMVDYSAFGDAFPAGRSTLATGGPVPGTSTEAVVGLAQVVKGLRIGAAAKYVNDEVSDTRVGRAAFDVGISKAFFRSYDIGLAVQNIGRDMAIPCSVATNCTLSPPMPTTGFGGVPAPVAGTAPVHLPLRTTLGIQTAQQLGIFDFTGTAAASVIRKDFFAPGGGAELAYSWLDGYNVSLRAGLRRPLPGEAAFTTGAGFRMDRLTIDYALETLSGGRVGHRIGLRIR